MNHQSSGIYAKGWDYAAAHTEALENRRAQPEALSPKQPCLPEKPVPAEALLSPTEALVAESASAKESANPDFEGEAPKRTRIDTGESEVRDALRYVMTEVKRLSNQYRYATLTKCHKAESGDANFDGRNLFLDVELDMLNGHQPSRHDIIVFKDEMNVITGMAIDEFPEVKFREPPDPDV